jgi:hypothetical protein
LAGGSSCIQKPGIKRLETQSISIDFFWNLLELFLSLFGSSGKDIWNMGRCATIEAMDERRFHKINVGLQKRVNFAEKLNEP